jgi:DNA/RNA endonuclease YhcR with UshA esterase domain
LGFCSNQPNGGMPSCPITKPAPVALGKSSDVAKQMVAIIDQNMQKYSESYNEVKGMQSKAAVAAAASQMLYDSVASEVARLKQDMEKLQNQAVTSKAQCHSATNSHLVASVSHERAVTTAKDVKSIDQELAVIQQLRQKLKEVDIIHSSHARILRILPLSYKHSSHLSFFYNFQLTAIKAVQTSNVQLDTSDSVARAISDASANMRPSTSLMLAEVIADVKNGRHFAETGEISKLLE